VAALELHCSLDGGRQGRLHVTQLPPAAPPRRAGGARASPLAAYKLGDSLSVLVRGNLSAPGGAPAVDAAGRPLLALALARERGAEEEATTAPPAAAHVPPTLEELAAAASAGGGAFVAYVERVDADSAVWLALAPALRGRLAALDATPAEAVGAADAKSLAQRFPAGTPVAVSVSACAPDTHRVDLRLQSAPCAPPAVGEAVAARVARAAPNNASLFLHLPGGRSGRVALTELADCYAEHPLAHLPPGTLVRAAVLGKSAEGHLDLSLRVSAGGWAPPPPPPDDAAAAARKQPALAAATDVAPGALVWGYVKACTPKGCFVLLGRGFDGRVRLCNLSRDYVPVPAAAFPAGTLVHARVLSVDAAAKRVELSLRAAEEDAAAAAAPGGALTLADLKVGAVVRGTVRRVETYGVFVTLDGGAGLTGMVHISAYSDERVKSLPERAHPGARVRCVVVEANVETGRLSLGMKASLFKELAAEQEAEAGDADPLAAAGEEEEEDEPEPAPMEASDEEPSSDSEPPPPPPKSAKKAQRAAEAAAAAAAEAAAAAATPKSSKKRRAAEAGGDALATLLGSGEDELAFSWGAAAAAAAGDADDAELGSPDGLSAGAAKRQRRRDKAAAEEALAARERALASGASAPQCAADFERALLASPSSSYLWISYMAHLASLGEPAAARAVAERALGGAGLCIAYREQKELLNVWIAALNLEASFGEPPREAAVAALFARAAQRCDPKPLHLALVGIHERAGQKAAALAAAGALTRKYGGSCKAWLRSFRLHLGPVGGGADAARACLDRAAAALPQRKTAKLLVAAALAWFRAGELEAGRALFEGVLAAQPKRSDVWAVYLDAEAKHGSAEPERGRALLARAAAGQLAPKRMKPLFKRALAAAADDEAVAFVRSLAAQYVAEHAGGADE